MAAGVPPPHPIPGPAHPTPAAPSYGWKAYVGGALGLGALVAATATYLHFKDPVEQISMGGVTIEYRIEDSAASKWNLYKGIEARKIGCNADNGDFLADLCAYVDENEDMSVSLTELKPYLEGAMKANRERRGIPLKPLGQSDFDPKAPSPTEEKKK